MSEANTQKNVDALPVEERVLELVSKINEMQARLNVKDATKQTEQELEEIAKLYKELGGMYGPPAEPEEVLEVVEVVESSLLEQYEQQVAVLQRLGLVKVLESGELGMVGIDNKEYSLPSREAVAEKIEKNRELVEKKSEQGFARLLMVPFGMKLEELAAAYKKSILEHHKQGKLFTAKKDTNDKNEPLVPLKLDQNNPLYMWDGYNNADVEGKLVYWPKEFSQNHGGVTKQEILKTQEIPGWDIILVEANPNIPRENNAKIVGGRTQLDTEGTYIPGYIEQGKTTPSPAEYLRALRAAVQIPVQNHMYAGESGMTPEDQLMCAITYLEEHDQVIDDYGGNGSLSYQIGAYFPASGVVPSACWNRGNSRAGMGRHDPRNRNVYCGVRPSVRI